MKTHSISNNLNYFFFFALLTVFELKSSANVHTKYSNMTKLPLLSLIIGEKYFSKRWRNITFETSGSVKFNISGVIFSNFLNDWDRYVYFEIFNWKKKIYTFNFFVSFSFTTHLPIILGFFESHSFSSFWVFIRFVPMTSHQVDESPKFTTVYVTCRIKCLSSNVILQVIKIRFI